MYQYPKMYKTKSRHRNINMKSQINTIATMTTSDFISAFLLRSIYNRSSKSIADHQLTHLGKVFCLWLPRRLSGSYAATLVSMVQDGDRRPSPAPPYPLHPSPSLAMFYTNQPCGGSRLLSRLRHSLGDRNAFSFDFFLFSFTSYVPLGTLTLSRSPTATWQCAYPMPTLYV